MLGSVFIGKRTRHAVKVLLFPAVNNYRRFLIHKTVEQFPELKTFSVGEGDERRTAVCFAKQSQRQALINLKDRRTAMAAAETKRASKAVPGGGVYLPPAMRAARSDPESPNSDSSAASANSGSRSFSKSKRPDMQVYVPRARRNGGDSPQESVPQANPPPPKVTKIRNSSPNVVTPRKKSASKANNMKLSSKALSNQSQSCDSDASSCDLLDDHNSFGDEEKKTLDDQASSNNVDVSEEKDKSKEEFEPEFIAHIESERQIEPTFVAAEVDVEEDSWDAMFDDSGECLDPKIMTELTQTLGKVKIEQPTGDYSSYAEAREKLLAEPDYSHVLEVYGFPADFKTQDLIAVLNPFAGRSGFDLKWVDDTHALGIFSNSLIAAEVLSVHHPLLKVRTLSQATAESKSKAKKCPQTLRPYRPRPETCTAMAKRMVSSALGVKLITSKEDREKEKNLLREAREKKRLAVKQSEDAWEGTISNCK